MQRIIQGVIANTLALIAGPITVSVSAALGIVLIIAATARAVTISKPNQ